MDNLTNLIQSVASSVANQVGGAISSVLSLISNGVQKNVIAPVTSGIDTTLNEIESSVSSLSKAAENGISNTITAASNSIGQFISSAETGFTQVLGGVESGVQQLATAIGTVFENIVSGVVQGFNSISGAVGSAIETVGQDIENGYASFAKVISDAFVPIFSTLTSFIEGLPADLEAIATNVVNGVEDVAKGVIDIGETVAQFIIRADPIKALEKTAEWEIQTFIDTLAPIGKQAVQLISEAAGVEISADLGVSLGRIAAIAAAENAIGGIEELFPGAAFILARLLNHIADSIAVGDFRSMQQAGNAGTPNMLLDIGEAIRGRARGSITDDQYYEILLHTGYTKANADVLYKNAEQLLGINDLVALYKRGQIPDMDTLLSRANEINVSPLIVVEAVKLFEKLTGVGEALELWRRGITPDGWATPFDDIIQQGFTDARIKALQDISYKLPSVFEYQDFVARNVDDDAHAQKFDLDFGINDEYFKIAKANGYDEVTAKRIYRSYWELPPFFLLINEFKSGKIPESDLRDALAFQRYTPYWIDRFIENLKPSLTAADIKDMYKYEVITAADIVPRLVSIGMGTALAEQYSELWQASIKRAAPIEQTATQAAAAALKGETAGLVTTAYKDGLMTNADAEAQLIALGKTQEAAQLMLAIADYELHQQNIKDVFASDKENYLAGNIDLNTVLADLANAGATTAQQNKYYNQLQYAGRSKPKSPSLAEFIKWFKGNLINASELIAGLQLLGYSDTWIPFYLIEAGMTSDAVAAMGYNITVPNAQS